jgi:hypothetical protein
VSIQRRSSKDTAGVQPVAEAGLRLPEPIAEAINVPLRFFRVSRMTDLLVISVDGGRAVVPRGELALVSVRHAMDIVQAA